VRYTSNGLVCPAPWRECPCKPRARDANRIDVRNLAFVPVCGLMFRATAEGPLVAGKVQHPHPIPGPAGFSRCGEAIDLYFCCESAQGAPAAGNGGGKRPAVQRRLPIGRSIPGAGRSRSGGTAGAASRTDGPELPRGTELRVEIPSYEMSDEVAEVLVTLREAESPWSGRRRSSGAMTFGTADPRPGLGMVERFPSLGATCCLEVESAIAKGVRDGVSDRWGRWSLAYRC
jgi:hypothetical protein